MAAVKRSTKTKKDSVKVKSRTVADLKAKPGKEAAVKGGIPRMR